MIAMILNMNYANEPLNFKTVELGDFPLYFDGPSLKFQVFESWDTDYFFDFILESNFSREKLKSCSFEFLEGINKEATLEQLFDEVQKNGF